MFYPPLIERIYKLIELILLLILINHTFIFKGYLKIIHLKLIIYNILIYIMSLTEKEIKEYIKLKEKKEKQNKYLNNYIKNKIKNAKENDHETYKLLMSKQNEANKKYKKQALQKLKEDPIKYKEYREKDVIYRNALKEQKLKQEKL